MPSGSAATLFCRGRSPSGCRLASCRKTSAAGELIASAFPIAENRRRREEALFFILNFFLLPQAFLRRLLLTCMFLSVTLVAENRPRQETILLPCFSFRLRQSLRYQLPPSSFLPRLITTAGCAWLSSIVPADRLCLTVPLRGKALHSTLIPFRHNSPY